MRYVRICFPTAKLEAKCQGDVFCCYCVWGYGDSFFEHESPNSKVFNSIGTLIKADSKVTSSLILR